MQHAVPFVVDEINLRNDLYPVEYSICSGARRTETERRDGVDAAQSGIKLFNHWAWAFSTIPSAMALLSVLINSLYERACASLS